MCGRAIRPCDDAARAAFRRIIAVNFSDKQFAAGTMAAWLAFYVEAQRSPAMRRLLSVYARRLHSNLMSGLIALSRAAKPSRFAEGIAALIDGLYIRRALKDGGPDADQRRGADRRLSRHECWPAEDMRMTDVRPNILIIMVDQFNGTLFPDGPADFLHAPNLKALAERSVRFANNYTASPLCAPGPRLVHERAIAIAHRGL